MTVAGGLLLEGQAFAGVDRRPEGAGFGGEAATTGLADDGALEGQPVERMPDRCSCRSELQGELVLRPDPAARLDRATKNRIADAILDLEVQRPALCRAGED